MDNFDSLFASMTLEIMSDETEIEHNYERIESEYIRLMEKIEALIEEIPFTNARVELKES